MRRNKSEAIELLEAFARGKDGVIIPGDVAEKLIIHAVNHNNICIRECNGTPMPQDQQRKQGIEHDVRQLINPLRLRVHFDGDPRGFTTKLHSPSEDVWNTWGGRETGYGIGDMS